MQKHFRSFTAALLVLITVSAGGLLLMQAQDPGIQRVGAIEVGITGSLAGDVRLVNATSGVITIRPPTGALGTPILTAPATTGTLLPQLGTTITLTNVDLDSTDNSIAAHVCEDQAVTATGIATTDKIVWTMTSTDLAVTFGIGAIVPSGANQVTVRACNNSVAAADPGAVADFALIRLP